MHRLSIKKGDSQRGAVTTVFVVAVSSGLLFLAFALTLDASSLYLERRSLQNASEATSLAVASFCAIGVDSSGVNYCNDARTQAERLITNPNSPDGISNIKTLCGFNSLNPCSSSEVIKCISRPTQNFARAVLTSKNKDGTTLVKSPFLDFLTGNQGTVGEVEACSQASWGDARSSAFSLPLAMSICDYAMNGYVVAKDYKFQNSTKQSLPNGICPTTIKDEKGNNLAPQPTSTIDGWILFARTGENLYCISLPGSNELIAGVTIITSLNYSGATCNDAGLTQRDGRANLISLISERFGKNVFVPVVSAMSGNGNTSGGAPVTGEIIGFTNFILLGYDFGNLGKSGCAISTVTKVGEYACSNFGTASTAGCGTGSQRYCIWGKFSRGIVPRAPISTSSDPSLPSLGAKAVQLLQ